MREQEPVSNDKALLVASLLQRRVTGESVARIIGAREFYGLSFRLSSATLEPRPETELLVDLALKALPQGGRMLDLGTGTGCIPIAILANRPDASGIATDLNPDALSMAHENAELNGVATQLALTQGNWFEALAFETSSIERLPGQGEGAAPGKFDLITSNPPYITSAVVETLAPEVKDFDPRLALDGGPDGLAPYRVIAAEAGGHLNSGGMVLVEIGYDQGQAVAALFAEHGFADIVLHKDLNGLDRVVEAHHFKDN